MIEENSEVIEVEESPEIVEDQRLQKSVDRLISITKVKKDALEGLSLEDQYDRLEFMLDNMPVNKVVKTKNRPIIPLPTTVDKTLLGRSVSDKGGEGVFFSTKEWLKKKK